MVSFTNIVFISLLDHNCCTGGFAICVTGCQQNFVPKKFRGINSEWFPLSRGRKWPFPGIPRFAEESIPKLGTERNDMKNIQKILLQQTELPACFCPIHASERNSESLLLFLFHGTEFRVGLSAVEWFESKFREFASIFVLRYRIPSFFLLCKLIRSRIPRVFCSAEQPEFRRNKPIVPYIPSSAE